MQSSVELRHDKMGLLVFLRCWPKEGDQVENMFTRVQEISAHSLRLAKRNRSERRLRLLRIRHNPSVFISEHTCDSFRGSFVGVITKLPPSFPLYSGAI